MNFDVHRYPPHTGKCPMCGKSTKANVHQQCGLAREAALRTKRQAREALAEARAPFTTTEQEDDRG